jgi:CRISPR-associated endonuclease Cas2
LNNGLWKKRKHDPASIKDKPFGIKVRNLSLYILEGIVDTIDNINNLGEVLIDRKSLYRIAYGGFYENSDAASKICNYLQSMRQRGYIEIIKAEIYENDSIVLTNKAKLKVIDKISDKAQSDGKKRFLSFDIPESMRKSRNKFRKAIKSIGFKKLQKSLWVIDQNVSDLVELAAYECRVEKYVIYIISEKSDADGAIEKLFD